MDHRITDWGRARESRNTRSRSPPTRRGGDRERDRGGGDKHIEKPGSPGRGRREEERRSQDRRHSDDDDEHRHRHRRRPKPAKAAPSPAARASAPPQELPFSARPLSKVDLNTFLPLLAYYLEVQKQRDVADMGEREVRGRWRSFRGKWNTGTLAAGWYDPELFARVADDDVSVVRARLDGRDDARDGGHRDKKSETDDGDRGDDGGDHYRHRDRDPNRDRDRDHDHDRRAESGHEDEDTEEEYYVPPLPPSTAGPGLRYGPTIPSLQDVALRREQEADDLARDRSQAVSELRTAREADRAEQRERLEELVPRADPGTRERRLEKQREKTERIHGGGGGGGGVAEVDEGDLMGGGSVEESRAEQRRMKEQEERSKTRREIRKEEWSRARQEERDQKLEAWREREEGTVSMLRELARQRFGE